MPKIILNEPALERLHQLIDAGAVDLDGEWEFSGDDSDRLLGDPADWGFYAKHFLGIDEEAEVDTQARYVYPFARITGEEVTVFATALSVIDDEAAVAGDAKIQEAAVAAAGRARGDADGGNEEPTDAEASESSSNSDQDGTAAGGSDASDPADGGDSGDGGTKFPSPGSSAATVPLEKRERPVLIRAMDGGEVVEIREGDVEYRNYRIALREIDEEKRLVPLTFSSDAPVDRGWCTEILDHGPGSVRMHRLQDRAAVLLGHEPDDHVGVIESAEIDSKAGLGRCLTRYGRSQRSTDIFNDMVDEIRCHVSVGYRIYKVEEKNLPGGGLEIRVVDWEPFEVSIVSIPADANKKVGVNRSFGQRFEVEEAERKEGVMPEVLSREDILQEDRKRRSAIREIGEKYGQKDLARRHSEMETQPDEFRLIVLEEIGKARRVTQEQIREEVRVGMSDSEVRQFSIHRFLRAQLSKDWSGAGLEREAADAAAAKAERAPNGDYIPYDVLAAPYQSQRDLNIADGSAQDGSGATLVGTSHLAGSMIDMLRPSSVLAGLGVRVIDGLVGNVEIPRRDTGATFYVIDNETTGVTESTPTFGQITGSPKTVAARVDITRAMLQQSSPAAEGLTRDDLVLGLGLKMDELGLTADGSGVLPVGLINLSGAGAVVGGANGAAPDFADIVGLETACNTANALADNSAYVFSPKVKGFLKTTEKAAGTAAFIMGEGRELNGYRVATTTQMPDDLTKGTSVGVCSALLYGNFTDAIMMLWGGIDLKADETTNGDKGGLVLRIFQDFWFAVRHPESFSVMKDALI